jgi:hypothetical protein
VRGSYYDAANQSAADPTPPESAALIHSSLEYSPSLSARFPSALRNKTLVGEAAVLAYHFWESRGCPRNSEDEEELAAAAVSVK